jgi:hypothetical protein
MSYHTVHVVFNQLIDFWNCVRSLTTKDTALGSFPYLHNGLDIFLSAVGASEEKFKETQL